MTLFNAPVISDLNTTQHENFHGFVMVDNQLMNAQEFSRALVTMTNDTVLTFVAIHGTAGIYQKVDWAKKLSGQEIFDHLNKNPELVAFTTPLKFILKPETKDQCRAWIVKLFGDNAVFAESKVGDRIELDFGTEHACIMLDIVTDV